MSDIVIVSASRTPIGAFNGALSSCKPHMLGATAIKSALARSGLVASDVDEVIMGQVLTAGHGQNPARQASLAAGIPIESPAFTINQVCGSGLRAVAIGASSIREGHGKIAVAGGQECMSASKHAAHIRSGTKMGELSLDDTLVTDGLWDVFNNYHMGVTAENVAKKWQISRIVQDEFALKSQHKAEAAQKSGRFDDEIAPVVVRTRKGEQIIEKDEYIRHGATIGQLQALRPVFDRAAGTVTAGNASGINDGAAVVVLMSESTAKERDLQPLGRIVSWAQVGVDPSVMGSGPIPASRKALSSAGWTVDSLDLVEANEAFAAQACAVNHDMGWDVERVNVNGGAIALGHPIGASGCRILVTLLMEMARRSADRGLATLCIGGGMGVAMCVERCS